MSLQFLFHLVSTFLLFGLIWNLHSGSLAFVWFLFAMVWFGSVLHARMSRSLLRFFFCCLTQSGGHSIIATDSEACREVFNFNFVIRKLH